MPKNKKSASNNYAKYSGLAVQLFVLLFIAVWVGKKLDARWSGEHPYFTVFLLIAVLVAYFYKLYKDLEKDRSE